jgi:hypothetical protein
MKANNINELSIKIGKTDTDRELLVLQLRKACAGMDREAIKAAIMPGWAQGAGITLTDEGNWPEDAGTAKRRFNRLISDILDDDSSAKASEPTKIRISKAEREAAEALLAACGGELKRAQAVLKAVA